MTTRYREFLARYRCSNPQPPGDPRSQGRRGGFLLACALLIVVAMAMAAAAAVSRGADRAAVVKLSDDRGMLSGVIVDPSGLVLSVSHGQFLPDKTVNVRLHDGTETRARLVWPGELPFEDVVALRLPTGPVYPYATLAKSDPPDGSIVWSFGYPAGTLDVLTGTVTSRVMVREDGKPGEPTPAIDTTIPARSGHSGGPLFNLAGEVSGLLWRSKDAATPRRVQRPGASMFVAVERARRAMEAAAAPGGPDRQTLYAFTGELCEPCERFKREYNGNTGGLASALNREYRVEIVRRGGGGWSNPSAAAEYSRFMGQRLDTVPRFWISGTKHGAQGYAQIDGARKLLAWLAEYRPPVQPQPLRPEPAPAPLIGINDGWQPGGGEFAVPGFILMKTRPRMRSISSRCSITRRGNSKRIYDLQTVALDPNNARAVGIHLVNKLDIKVFEMFQTKRKYNEPLKEFLEALHDGRIIHGGNPLLKWCASNVITETDAAGCSMPAKAKSSEKIDPIVAIIMALSECLFAEQVSAGAYDQPGGSVLF